jgi:hypothetical protein
MNLAGVINHRPNCMLPFLKKKIGSTLIMQQKPDGSIEDSHDEEGLSEAIQDLFMAYEKKDVEAGARAFRAAFQILESEPHEENEE